MHWKKTLVLSCGILLAGGVTTALIFFTEPTATRSGATKETAMLVDIIEVRQGSYHPEINVMGTVRPSQDIVLSPRVTGEIIDRSESFTPGGYLRKGETLLQIDPSDYRNILQQRRSDLQQALADLKIEMGRQNVAFRDYQMLEDSLSGEKRSLVLREPQLDAVKSRVQSARATVEQAELELERTTIRAPFDAHILTRNANIGSQVAPGDNLGRLVGLDTYWVEATVPLSQIRWLTFPQDGRRGSEVRIRNRSAWEQGEYRTGYLFQLVGSLENQTRMARVLIEVPDPHALVPENRDKPRMIIGSYVEARIQARELADVIRLSRDYIRSDNTVWIMDQGRLNIRKVNIAFRDARYAYITSGLNGGERVITTNLSTVVEGAPLRLEDSTDTVSNARDSLSEESR